MTQPDRVADELRELSRQVRWLRHAIQRMLWLLGLLSGIATVYVIVKIVMRVAA